jgi:GntR family transcriptional regulator
MGISVFSINAALFPLPMRPKAPRCRKCGTFYVEKFSKNNSNPLTCTCVLVCYICSTKEEVETVLNLDEQSGVPFYLQVVQQVKRQIASGAIVPGDQLPAVRDMARDLVLNPNTIAKAYQELEREGVVESRRGLGTFARAPLMPMTDADRRSVVSELLVKALVEAEQVAVSPEEVVTLLKKLIEEKNEQRIIV